MARPLQYQSQYVPTDFNQVGNVLGMYRQDMQQRNQEFDQGVANQNKAIAEVYGQETLDPELFQQAGDTLANTIEEAVKAKGMDYGAASSDISRIIAKEMRNPIYNLNKRKLDQVKQLEQQLARNPNMWVTQDPRTIDITQKGLTPADIKYGIADPSEIDKSIESIYGDLAKQQRESSPILDPNGSGYNIATTTLGLSPQEISELQQNPEVAQNILSNIPQLAPYLDQNPELANRVQERISTGLNSLSRGQRKQFLRPLTQATSSSNLTPSSAIGSYFTPTNDIEVNSKMYKQASQAQQDINNITNAEGNIIKPTKEGKDVVRPYTGMYGIAPSITKDETTEERNYNKFIKYKNKYSVLYNKLKESNISDSEFINNVTNIEKNKSFVLNSRIGFNDPEFSKTVVENFDFNKSQFIKMKEGKETKEDLSFKDYNDKFKGTGVSYKDSKIFLNPKGQVIVQDPEGTEYKVNEGSFNTVTRKYLNTLGNIYDSFYDYTLDNNQMNDLNKKVYSLGNNMYVKVSIPDNDITKKQIVIAYPDPETGKITPKKMDSIEQFYGYMSQLVNADVFKGK